MRNAWLVFFALAGCRAPASRPHAASHAPPVESTSAAAPSQASEPPPPPSATAPPPHPSTTLSPAALTNLQKKWPRATVQSAVQARTPSGVEIIALVWEAAPTPETRCPAESELTSAYDIQSCTGFIGALGGDADAVRLRDDAIVDVFPLTPLFADDNPAGVEIAGKRGKRQTYLPRDYALELYDLDGDGYATEFLLQIGNAPYAEIGYWVGLGIFGGRLGPAVLRKGAPLVAARAAWLDLASKGRGVSQYYCGARCGNSGTRWTLERGAGHRVVSREFWSCTPDDEKSWKPAPEPDGACER